MSEIAIVVPVLNEGAGIRRFLLGLQAWREAGHEVIVVDGGSTDATVAQCTGLCDRLLVAAAGRAVQMNAGAVASNARLLLFLHADTLLPATTAARLLPIARSTQPQWGRFDVRLDGTQAIFRVIEFMMNWRSRLSGIATGDQAIFVHRELFVRVGGYPAIRLMEDIALSRLLKRVCRPVCLRLPVTTSARRWQQHGVLRTILRMWWLRGAYFLGVSPGRLSHHYHDARSP